VNVAAACSVEAAEARAEGLVPIAEVAALVPGVTDRALNYAIQKGDLARVLVDGRRWIHPDDVREWHEQRAKKKPPVVDDRTIYVESWREACRSYAHHGEQADCSLNRFASWWRSFALRLGIDDEKRAVAWRGWRDLFRYVRAQGGA